MRMDSASTIAFEPPARTPVFVPTAQAMAQSHLSAFAAWLGQDAGIDLQDPARLYDFSVTHYREFWGQLLSWSGLRWEGDPKCVCDGDACETATFFPDLRLNYAENVLDGAEASPDALALVSRRANGKHTRLTRAALRRRVECLAAALHVHGIGAGDSVVAILRNDSEAVVAALAVAAVGATLAVAAPEMGAPAIIAQFAPLAPRLLMAHVGPQAHDTGVPLVSRVAQVAAALPRLELCVALDDAFDAAFDVAFDSALDETSPQSSAGGPAVLNLSTLLARQQANGFHWQRFAFNHPLFVMAVPGATGRPNCVIHSAGGVLLEHVKEHRLHCDLRPTDKLYFQTSCGWMMWQWQLSALASGCAIVLYDGPIRDATTLWQIVHAERVTVFGTSPPYLKLSEHAGLSPGSEFDLGALRTVLSTGSTLYEPTHTWVSKRVKAVPLQALFGSPDILGCFVLGNPKLPVYAGEFQCLSLGLDVRAAPAANGHGTELVCANPFPSRPLGFAGDADGSRFHASYFARHPGLWSEAELIELTAEGTVRLHGRADGVMNVRGIRVAPAEIREVLHEFEQIREAAVIEQHSPSTFSEGRAVLLLVMHDGAVLEGPLIAKLRRRLAEAASAAHVPDVVLQVDELPRTHAGEVSEAALSDAVNGRALSQSDAQTLRNPECLDAVREAPALRAPDLLSSDSLPPPPAPGWRSRRDHEMYLRSLWEKVFGFAPIGLDDDFFELGGHSLLAARMFADIRRSTSQELALSTLLKAPTVRQLAGVFDAAAWDLPVPLVQLRPGVGRPLFLMHSLAGTFLELWAVLRALDIRRPVYGLQARGLGVGQEPLLRVADMAREYIGHMRRVQPEGPYAVGGYSFGGLVAYEVAQQLRRQGQAVELLTLIDTQVHGRYLPFREWVRHCAGWLQVTVRRVAALAYDEQLDYLLKKSVVLLDRIRVAFGHEATRPDLVGDLVSEANFPPAMRRVRGAMLLAMREYRPEPYPGNVVFLRASVAGASDPLSVWSKVVRGGLEVNVTPGDHDEMIVGTNAKALALALARHL
jgi:acetoacetyl-CoA synthetase